MDILNDIPTSKIIKLELKLTVNGKYTVNITNSTAFRTGVTIEVIEKWIRDADANSLASILAVLQPTVAKKNLVDSGAIEKN